MDIFRLGSRLIHSVQSGNTSANVTLDALPATIIEAVIPGYGGVSHFIKGCLGFDISLVVATIALVLGLHKTGSWAWNYAYRFFRAHCMSSVFIDESDDLFPMVLKWLHAKRLTRKTRQVKACTQYTSKWDDDSDAEDIDIPLPQDGGHFNFGKWQSQIPPRYEPYYGDHHFWVRGRLFCFRRSQKQTQVQQITRWGRAEPNDLLQIQCVGFSTRPIKAFLQSLKLWHSEQKESRTSIKNARSSRHGIGWGSVQSRPSRPIDTVILDEQQKELIVRDMDDFLHPESCKWYASRGIPYRRGYLFHGPPGTGKTSLSFALAGIFGLDIYCCALNDPDISESDLRDLFNCLPRRCIVLLEDIDEAGIKQREDSAAGPDTGANNPLDSSEDKPSSGGDGSEPKSTDDVHPSRIDSGTSLNKADAGLARSTESSTTASVSTADARETEDKTTPNQTAAVPAPAEPLTADSLAKALIAAAATQAAATAAVDPDAVAIGMGKDKGGRRNRKRRAGQDPFSGVPTVTSSSSDENSGISLSGLLNAIDGVATHEGRVLIMTTNHPEKLDEALVRAGRVDVKIGFEFASGEQVRMLFCRMFGGDLRVGRPGDGSGSDGDGEERERGSDDGMGKGKGKGNKKGMGNNNNNETGVKSWWEGLDLFAPGAEAEGHSGGRQKDTTKRARLKEAAARFAAQVPERVFSPSDVQGFLLLHKKTPLKALNEVGAWVEKELRAKREKRPATTAPVAAV